MRKREGFNIGSRKNNITAYLAIAYFILALLCVIYVVPQQVFISSSCAAAIFTLGQIIRAEIRIKNANVMNYAQLCKEEDIGISDFQLDFIDQYSEQLFQTKKEIVLLSIAATFECLAIIVLVVAFIIPIKSERIGNVATMISLALLFYSLWQSEKEYRLNYDWAHFRQIRKIANITGEDINIGYETYEKNEKE